MATQAFHMSGPNGLLIATKN